MAEVIRTFGEWWGWFLGSACLAFVVSPVAVLTILACEHLYRVWTGKSSPLGYNSKIRLWLYLATSFALANLVAWGMRSWLRSA